MALLPNPNLGLPEWVMLHLDGLRMQEQGMGTTFDWGGLVKIPCVAGPEMGGKRISEGGFRLQANLRIMVRASNFPAGVGLPQEKQTIMFRRSPASDAKKLRIDGINNYYDAWLELDCQDPSAGA